MKTDFKTQGQGNHKLSAESSTVQRTIEDSPSIFTTAKYLLNKRFILSLIPIPPGGLITLVTRRPELIAILSSLYA